MSNASYVLEWLLNRHNKPEYKNAVRCLTTYATESDARRALANYLAYLLHKKMKPTLSRSNSRHVAKAWVDTILKSCGVESIVRDVLIDVPLSQITGRTIARVVHETVEVEYGKAPAIRLYFRDNTRHSFILPTGIDDNYEHEGEEA